jgi:hypothetical protein
MRKITFSLLLVVAASASCGDDSAPPGQPDAAAADAPAPDAAMIDAALPPDAYEPRCFLQCFVPHEVCVDPDGPGGNPPFCGCLDDVACRGTGTCDMPSGLCRCGGRAPCVEGLSICVNGSCVAVPDAGP